MNSMKQKHPFENFLIAFTPKIAAKSKQLNQALWLLETTGSLDAADLKAELDTELRLLFSNSETYHQLLAWDKDEALLDPLLKRQLNVLIRAFKQNNLPHAILADIAKKEADILYSYANFRPQHNGCTFSENDIREILKKSVDVQARKQAWEASKEIGEVLAPQIIALIKLRNQGAQRLGYSNYFQMQLDLQEVDEAWLFQTLEALSSQSEKAYNALIGQIEEHQCLQFNVTRDALGPWAWSEPFCQEDPIDTAELDALVSEIDMCAISVQFYQKIGFDIEGILKNSDMFERSGKNQHAFCINMDRKTDIRTLNNLKSTLKWMETVLHEFGHAVYDLGFDKSLPWLLREPPHMVSTEAMALIAGRQAYLSHFLSQLSNHRTLIIKAGDSLKRRQLIFSRWVIVMTHFERELYHNPEQDLNILWWKMVARYQKINPPKQRESKNDWAAKYHIGLAPVYYYSYLLGEMLASAIEEALIQETGSKDLVNPASGRFLQEKLFRSGNSMRWTDLIQQVLKRPFTPAAWISQFANDQLLP